MEIHPLRKPPVGTFFGFDVPTNQAFIILPEQWGRPALRLKSDTAQTKAGFIWLIIWMVRMHQVDLKPCKLEEIHGPTYLVCS